jgi:hypothetical protein
VATKTEKRALLRNGGGENIMGNKWEEREGRKESVVTEKWRRGENE